MKIIVLPCENQNSFSPFFSLSFKHKIKFWLWSVLPSGARTYYFMVLEQNLSSKLNEIKYIELGLYELGVSRRDKCSDKYCFMVV